MLQDVFRGSEHFAFCMIGGTVVPIESYSAFINTRGESQTADIRIPLENIESSVFADDANSDDHIPVQIWAGYLEDTKNRQEQIGQLIREIYKVKDDSTISQLPSRKFVKRFEGFVSQPEWSFGESEYVDLSCLDWSSILREYEYYKNFNDGACEIRNIVSTIQKDFSGIKIELEDYKGSVRLGEYDNVDQKQTYNSSGKKYWDILDDCAKKLGYIIIVQGRTIKLTSQKKSPYVWPIFYGDKENILDENGVAKGQVFQNLRVRWGAKGHIEKSNIVIECFGVDDKKKGKDRQIRIIFPEDQAITSVTRYVRINVPGDCNKTILKTIAENEYRERAARLVTGTLDLPFANPHLELRDILEMVIDKTRPNALFLNGYWFETVAISENFSAEEYSQNVEYEANPVLPQSVFKKIAPQNITNIYGVKFNK
jgi:hypothetical protein